MPLNLAALRDDLRDHLGLSSTELVDANADKLLNRAYWEIQDKFPFRSKQSSDDVTTVDGTEGYAVPTDVEYIEKVVYIDPTYSNQTVLQRLDLDKWTELRNTDEDYRGAPTHYYIRNDEILLHPIPDDAYDIKVYYNAILADLSTDGPEIPQVWHEILLFGAIHRGYLKLGDYNRGNSARAHQRELLGGIEPQESKEEKDDQYAGLYVLRRSYR